MTTVASAVRGGRSAGLLEVEQAGGIVSIPPPPPPPLAKGERCFRARAREYRYLLKDTRTVVAPNGEAIPGERRWLKFKSHPSGLFGQLITSDPLEISTLEALAGITCHKHKDDGGKPRRLEACRAERLPCWGLEQEGEVWEADAQAAEYDTLRAQQIADELKARPELREKLRTMGDASELFQLGEPQRPARQPKAPKQQTESNPPGTSPEGYNLEQ